MEQNTPWKSWVRKAFWVSSLSTPGAVGKPALKSGCVRASLLLFKDMEEKAFHLEVVAAYAILGLF